MKNDGKINTRKVCEIVGMTPRQLRYLAHDLGWIRKGINQQHGRYSPLQLSVILTFAYLKAMGFRYEVASRTAFSIYEKVKHPTEVQESLFKNTKRPDEGGAGT